MEKARTRAADSRVVAVHAIDRDRLLLSFDTGETCSVQLRPLLGDERFDQTFPTQARFGELRVSPDGGLVWEGGFSLSGAKLYAEARLTPSITR